MKLKFQNPHAYTCEHVNVYAGSTETGKEKCLFKGSVIFSLGSDVGELIRALTIFEVDIVC